MSSSSPLPIERSSTCRAGGPDGLEPVSLPWPYAAWVRQLLDGPLPAETAATCDDCAMCAPPGLPPDPRHFDPVSRCCTYAPPLPSFLAGALLRDRSPLLEGAREVLRQRISSAPAVTPLGLGASPRFRLLYGHAPAAFGRARSLRCPFHGLAREGACGIWPYRGAVCATWFCKHDRGAAAARFWSALRALLAAVDRALALWCVLESDLDGDLEALLPAPFPEISPPLLSPTEVDEERDQAAHARVWGRGLGRETEHYLGSAARVERLGWAEVEALGGPVVRARAGLVLESYRALEDPELPARLVPGRLELADTEDERVQIVSYNAFDPLELPRGLLAALPLFDGRPTGEVLRSIEEEAGIDLTPDLLRLLVDFEVLVPPITRAGRAGGEHRLPKL